MNPYLVISSDPNNFSEESYSEWIKVFDDLNETFEVDSEKLNYLMNRLKKAHTICTRRNKTSDVLGDEEEKEFSALSYLNNEENKSLDGDYPFFNDEDIKLAYKVFTKREIALIQLGLDDFVACGDIEPYNFRPQIRRGLISEIKKDYYNASKCYENIPASEIKERYIDCKKIATQMNHQILDDAIKFCDEKLYKEAYTRLKKVALMGDVETSSLLGYLLINGFGIEKNVSDGFDRLLTGAYLGSSRAKQSIVELYDDGTIRGYIDEDEVERFCQEAANAGNQFCVERLKKGFGTETKLDALEAMINEGNVDAMRLLGEYYLEEGDDEKASKMFFEASEKGDYKSSLYLAETCEKVYSKEFAEEYYVTAAKQGSTKAVLWLGNNKLKNAELSFWELSTPVDKKTTLEHRDQFISYLEAAKMGDDDAMIKVANGFLNGYPFDKDLKEAHEWAYKAYDKGNMKATYILGMINECDSNNKERMEEALRWLNIGAENGDALSISKLYTIYCHGEGTIKPNSKKANGYMYLLHAI